MSTVRTLPPAPAPPDRAVPHAALPDDALLAWDRDAVSRAVESLVACALACTACADASLVDDAVAGLSTAIRADRDCADSCGVTARMLSRNTGAAPADHVVAQLRSCLLACRASRLECAAHADLHDHCRACADATLAGEQACAEMLARVG